MLPSPECSFYRHSVEICSLLIGLPLQFGQQLGYVFFLDVNGDVKIINFAEYRTNPWTTTQYFSFGPNHPGD